MEPPFCPETEVWGMDSDDERTMNGVVKFIHRQYVIVGNRAAARGVV